MKWYNSIKVKLLGFFFGVSIVFMITMFGLLTMLKEDSLMTNASKEVSLATIKILNNLQNTKYRLEEIVLALASVSQDFKDVTQRKKIINNVLRANNSGLVTSGGVWFEPYVIDKNKKDYSYFFNRTSKNHFELIEDYTKESPINYRVTEYYMSAKFLKRGETFWTKVYKDPVTQVRMVTVVAPIYKDNQFLGAASLDIRIKEHGEKIFSSFKFPDRYLMMVDREGAIMIKSTLLSKYLSSNRLYKNRCDDFIKEYKEMESIIKKCNIPQDYNRTIAKELSSKSPEIDMQESKRIATIIQSREENLKKGLSEDIKLVEYDPILKQESIIANFFFPVTQWNVIIGIPKEQVLNESNTMYEQIIEASIYLTLLATLIGYFLLKGVFINPVEDISEQLAQNSVDTENHYKLLTCSDKGEIGDLVDNLNIRTTALIESQIREAKEIDKRLINEKLLEQQSKMAAMGEMMDAVAHQWKQPLNALSMYSEIIKSDFKDGEVDEVYITKFRDDIQLQIQHMLTTLDEFRTFFRPNKNEENFQLIDVVNSVLFLTKDEFMKNSIRVDVLQEDSIEIYGFRNEFKHLILNIINNAKDAFNENKIEKRVISFSLINDKDGNRLEIRDNAGGIPKEIIDDVFKANVTTKSEGKGTGIGLFMSMKIAQKHKADLSVHNENSGACFVVKFTTV